MMEKHLNQGPVLCREGHCKQNDRTRQVTTVVAIVAYIPLVCMVVNLLVQIEFMKKDLAKQQQTISYLQGSRHPEEKSASVPIGQRPLDISEEDTYLSESDKLDIFPSLRHRRQASYDTSPAGSTGGQDNDRKTSERLAVLEAIVEKQHPQWSSVHMYSSKSAILHNLGESQYRGLLNNSKTLRIWQKHNWDDNMSYMPRFVDINHLWEDGTVMIREAGLYLIYAQVTFQTSALHQAIAIQDSTQKKSLATCIVSERFDIGEHLEISEDPFVYLPCSLTTVQYLRSNSTLSISSLYEDRRILLRESFTYWGVTQLWRA